MNRLEGSNPSKGFVGSPEYKARQTGLEQIKKLTPKELANSLTPAQPDASRDQGKLYYGELHYNPDESYTHFKRDKKRPEPSEEEKKRIKELVRRWMA